MFNWFVGLAPLLLSYGWAALLFAGLLAGGVYFQSVRLLVLAAMVAMCAVSFTVGVSVEHKRDEARWNASVEEEIKHANQDRVKADRDVERSGDRGMRNDPRNRDNNAPRHHRR